MGKLIFSMAIFQLAILVIAECLPMLNIQRCGYSGPPVPDGSSVQLRPGGGAGTRLRARSALAPASVGSWEIHQSWFKSHGGRHDQDTWMIMMGFWDIFWIGVWKPRVSRVLSIPERVKPSARDIKGPSVPTDITRWALHAGNWLPSIFYLLYILYTISFSVMSFLHFFGR